MALAIRDVVRDMYIAGEWVEAPRRFPVTDPATLEVIAEVPDASVEEVRRAIEAAHGAFPAWSRLPADQRAEYLYKAYEAMLRRQDDLAELLTRENGKPLAEARGEVAIGAKFLQWHAEEAKRVYGDVVPSSAENRRVLVLRQPVGVVGAITPWNFPLSMITRKLGPALAAGCTAVLRPASATPLTAMAVFECFHEAGIPAGVANLVTTASASAVGDEFLANPLVRKIAFTGSTDVGKHLMRGAADQVKRVSLELGGHAPFLVFDDADLEQAAAAAITSRFRNAGQTCICANRLYVQRPVAERFSQLLAEKARALRVGYGLEPGVNVGPLINEQGFQKTRRHVEDALSKGATVLTGGKPSQTGLRGYFFEPTVLADVNHDMLVTREETFGPVLPVIPFNRDEEAVERANDTPFGLAAYLFARDVGRLFRVAESLEYGIIGANDPIPVGPQIPFGGYKQSGLGREAGAEGIHEFLEVKAVSIGL